MLERSKKLGGAFLGVLRFNRKVCASPQRTRFYLICKKAQCFTVLLSGRRRNIVGDIKKKKSG